MPHPSAIKVFSPTFTGITLAVSPPTTKNVVGGLRMIGVAKHKADDNIISGYYFVNLYDLYNTNYPQKDVYAILIVFNVNNVDAIFQHLICSDGSLYVRLYQSQKWRGWKKVGA